MSEIGYYRAGSHLHTSLTRLYAKDTNSLEGFDVSSYMTFSGSLSQWLAPWVIRSKGWTDIVIWGFLSEDSTCARVGNCLGDRGKASSSRLVYISILTGPV